jgi:hypothetical protein
LKIQKTHAMTTNDDRLDLRNSSMNLGQEAEYLWEDGGSQNSLSAGTLRWVLGQRARRLGVEAVTDSD